MVTGAHRSIGGTGLVWLRRRGEAKRAVTTLFIAQREFAPKGCVFLTCLSSVSNVSNIAKNCFFASICEGHENMF